MKILQSLQKNFKNGKKSVAVLIDPDKTGEGDELYDLIALCNRSAIDYFFVGGSLITTGNLSTIIPTIKSNSDIPVILFPSSNMHIDMAADAVLFLSLISGRNPEWLIGQHVVAAPLLKSSGMEVLPTGYILVSSDRNTSVAYMSNTTPIPADKYSIAASTALAGELLGLKTIYLDAGSGGHPISGRMISEVHKTIDIPLMVGGGINSVEKARSAFESGADVIVIGNAAEKNPDFLIGVSELVTSLNKRLDVH